MSVTDSVHYRRRLDSHSKSRRLVSERGALPHRQVVIGRVGEARHVGRVGPSFRAVQRPPLHRPDVPAEVLRLAHAGQVLHELFGRLGVFARVENDHLGALAVGHQGQATRGAHTQAAGHF